MKNNNQEFLNSYNKLDYYLKRLTGIKSGNLIFELELILPTQLASSLKTIRLNKNINCSHGVMVNYEAPKFPKSWKTFLDEIYTYCVNNSKKVKKAILNNNQSKTYLNKSYQNIPYNKPSLYALWNSKIRKAAKEVAEYENINIKKLSLVHYFYIKGRYLNNREIDYNTKDKSPCFDEHKNYAFFEVPIICNIRHLGLFFFIALEMNNADSFISGILSRMGGYKIRPYGFYKIDKFFNITKTQYGIYLINGHFATDNCSYLEEIRRTAYQNL